MIVSKSGVPGNMEIIDPPESITKNAIRAIFKDIRGKRYRPKLVDGETTESNLIIPYARKQSQGE